MTLQSFYINILTELKVKGFQQQEGIIRNEYISHYYKPTIVSPSSFTLIRVPEWPLINKTISSFSKLYTSQLEILFLPSQMKTR